MTQLEIFGGRTLKSEIVRAPDFHQKLNQILMLLLDGRSKMRRGSAGGKVLQKKVKKSSIRRRRSRGGQTAPAEAERRERTRRRRRRRQERKIGTRRACVRCGLAGVKKRRGEYSGM